jgi:hypothetical protein
MVEGYFNNAASEALVNKTLLLQKLKAKINSEGCCR